MAINQKGSRVEENVGLVAVILTYVVYDIASYVDASLLIIVTALSI